MASRLILALPWLFVGRFAVAQQTQFGIDFDCDPCIERRSRVVRVILHGTRDNPFWQRMERSIRQAAEAMRVTLQFELYRHLDFAQMASDIRTVAATSPRARPDVLVVTLPSVEVEEAVREAVNAGVPVFGMNSGYDRAADLGLLNFVGMDEFQAGMVAARQFQKLALERDTPLQKILFINHEKGNIALDHRRKGLEEGLSTLFREEDLLPDELLLGPSAQNMSDLAMFTDSSSVPRTIGIGIVEEFVMDGIFDPDAPRRLHDVLEGCTHHGIVIHSDVLDLALEARSSACPSKRIPLGSFDTTTRLYQNIAAGLVDFSISQQAWMQGAMATAMASLYASTGMRLEFSSETTFGTYLSGPNLVTIENVPPDNLQTCETEAFPLCSSQFDNIGLDAAGRTERGCLCFEPSNIQIAAVTHGINTSPFWRRPRDAALQAARDMQVDLEFDLNPPEDDPDVLHTKMANQMISHCQSGVDGLIVTIPSELVVLALEQCLALNVPIVSINAGGDTSEQLGLLHHVAQDEYAGGYAAGEQLIQRGATRGICLNHVPELDFVVERCVGFRDALVDLLGGDSVRVEDIYLGMVGVVEDNNAITISRTVQAVDDFGGGDWSSLGILVAGNALLPALLNLLDDHPDALGGTFDTGPLVSSALEDKRIVFGIDQQSYLQGYVPVLLLTWFAQTRQALINRNIASGPSLVLSQPTAAQQVCEENDFAVCLPPVVINKNFLGSSVRTIGYVLGGIILLSAFGIASSVAIFRNTRVTRKAQPFFLLVVSLGAALMGSTIFALGVDDEIASQHGCDVACMTAPWLFTVGFTIVFAALYSKLRRLNILIQTMEQFRRIDVTLMDIMTPFAILLSINLFFLTIWTVVDPMYWKRTEESETESYGICRLGDDSISIAMASSIFGVNLAALILAMLEAYKARKVSFDLSGSGSVGLVVVSILQAATVGVPILPLVRDDPSASYLLKSGLVFVMSMSTLLFIFSPLLWRGLKRRRRASLNMMPSTMPDTTIRNRPQASEETTNTNTPETAPATSQSGSNLPPRRKGETIGEYVPRTKYGGSRKVTRSIDGSVNSRPISRKSEDSWMEIGMDTVIVDDTPEDTLGQTGKNSTNSVGSAHGHKNKLEMGQDATSIAPSDGIMDDIPEELWEQESEPLSSPFKKEQVGEVSADLASDLLAKAEDKTAAQSEIVQQSSAAAERLGPPDCAPHNESELSGIVNKLVKFVQSSGIERNRVLDLVRTGLSSSGGDPSFARVPTHSTDALEPGHVGENSGDKPIV